ncbi:hypothetical protein [Shimia sp.]|uniref:hypothetical protein n=1 Tax=Shimia sp. TaxID=1954381 RepID=UPI003B8D1D3B
MTFRKSSALWKREHAYLREQGKSVQEDMVDSYVEYAAKRLALRLGHGLTDEQRKELREHVASDFRVSAG